MSLIELICSYAEIVQESGRVSGHSFLINSCDESLHDHIINTVSDDGVLIDAFGEPYELG